MDQAVAQQASPAQPKLLNLVSRVMAIKQLGLILGASAALALLSGVFIWSQTPAYRVLYSGLSEKDAGQVMEVLQKSSIPFRVDRMTGALEVPENQVHETRLKLAAQGLPKGAGVGYEMLDEQQTLGSSHFMEAARYQRALETELARSIMTLNAVQNARVHLALPKQSVFIREHQTPSASVLLRLYPGRELEPGQVAAIVHLVAASVPQLTIERVTVVDQNGRLLTRDDSANALTLSQDQLDYTRQIEASYIKRIEDLISPIMGEGKVRAQVAADIDFAVTEQTQELFNPKMAGVRSEQVLDEQSFGAGPEGIPGALSNQPPTTSSVPEKVPPAGQSTGEQKPMRKMRRETRNYELDKTISHTRFMPGKIRRLSVAVVVDDRISKDHKGSLVRTPLTSEQLARITALVKEAVGFRADRGDTVHVTNASFAPAPAAEVLPEPTLWEQPWLRELIKPGLGALIILMVVFGVIRPLLQRRLDTQSVPMLEPPVPGKQGELELAEDRVSLTKLQGVPELPNLPEYETPLQAVKASVEQDPWRAAQVIRSWLASDA